MFEDELCKNCNSKLTGIYCSKCGQKNTELLSVRAIMKEFTDSVFSFDSRFFITLKYLITKPGFLTIEYWSGKKINLSSSNKTLFSTKLPLFSYHKYY